MRILLSAYACRPNEGSEQGLGWGWATTLASLGHEVHVLTRARNRAAIEEELASRPVAGLSFSWVDLPLWVQYVLRRGAGGKRLYYAAWQWAAYGAAKRRLAETDVIHHATYAKYWALCPLAFLPRPFLWGPVGGGEDAPLPHWRHLGWHGIVFELARNAARTLSHLNPLLRMAARRARLAVATTPETAVRLRALGAPRVVVRSQVALTESEIAELRVCNRPAPPPWRLALSGDLVPLKAPHLVIGALARLQDIDWQLDVFGAGPGRELLERQAAAAGMGNRVIFHGRLPRRRALAAMGGCHALLFAGLHDSGGMVCAEAMATGLPVVAMALGGPRAVLADGAGILVEAPDPETAMAGMARALRTLMAAPHALAARSEAARAHAAEHFAWPRRAQEIYSLLLERMQ